MRRKWLEPGERAALAEACGEVDPGRLGRIPVAAIGKVLAAVGSEVNPLAGLTGERIRFAAETLPCKYAIRQNHFRSKGSSA